MSEVKVVLRAIHDSDLPVFFRQMMDPESVRMAAFTAKDPTDRDAFDAHWKRIRSLSDVVNRTVLVDGDVVGNAAVYGPPDEREVTYWIDRAYWGRGSPRARCGRCSMPCPSVRCSLGRRRTTRGRCGCWRSAGFASPGGTGVSRMRGARRSTRLC